MPLEAVAKLSESEVEVDLGTYIWSVPGGPVRVHLPLRTVDDIDAYSKHQTLSALPGAGAQKSGILLGSNEAPRAPKITSFKAAASERLPDMAAALASVRKDKTLGEPVGFFRTHAHSRLFLSASDIALAEKFFSDPACVFLLIHYPKDGPAKAGFFFWDRGYLNADFCFLEFPFSVPALTKEEQKAAVPPAAPAPQIGAAPAPVQKARAGALHIWNPASEMSLVSSQNEQTAIAEQGGQEITPRRMRYPILCAFLLLLLIAGGALYWRAGMSLHSLVARIQF